MSLLHISDFPAIRAALDVSLKALALPDAVIALPIYQGAAEAEVLARDPLAESRTGAALQHVVNAAICLAAAYIAPAMPALTAEQIGQYRYQREVDWPARAAELRARADAELAAVLTPSTALRPAPPSMFAVASGRRGQ